MLDCRQSSKLVSDAMDRRLTGRERIALRLHLLMCRYCRTFARQLGYLRELVSQAGLPQDERLSEQQREQLRESLGKPDSTPR